MKTKKSDLISTYAQSIGIETAKELIAAKINAATLEDKESYTGEEVARICNELAQEGGLIRIVAQTLLVQLERRMSEEQTLLLDNIETQIWYLTDAETCGAVNKAHAEFLGMVEGDLEGKNLHDIVGREEARVYIEGNREVFEKKREVHTEEWVENGKGAVRLLSIKRTPKLDNKGNVEYVICAADDITERVLAEQRMQRLLDQQIAVNQLALALGETRDLDKIYYTIYEHIRAMVDAWTFIVSSYDDETQLIRAEYAMHKDVALDVTNFPALPLARPGRGAQSQVIRTGEPLYTPDHLKAMEKANTKYTIAENGTITKEPQPEDKPEDTPHSALYVPIKIAGKTIGVMQLQSTRPDAYTQEDIDLLSALANVAAVAIENARLLEKTREQARQMQQTMDTVPEGVLLLGADSDILLVNPPAREYLAALTDAKSGDTLTHLGGRPLAELLTLPPKGLWHEVTTDGRIFEVIARPIEADPTTGGWAMIIRDVTQEREIQQRVQQQERLAAVGQLAAGIAHDFNNILAVVVLYTQIVLRTSTLSAKSQERLQTIDHQAKRATDLIQQILDFGRRAVLERQALNLTHLLEEQAKMLTRTLPENIRLELTHGPDNYLIHADPTRMQQAIMNLALNARDAMPEGGVLRIRLDRTRVGKGEHPPLPEMPVGDWVQVTVSDSGTGIPPEALPHIYEPFFTTKEVGKGTGLGLSQVYGIIRQHEGYMDVKTETDQGTTFTLYLPALRIEGSEICG